MIGYNYRMTNLNAAVGLAQLERLEDMLAAKRALAARYDATLAGRADLAPMPRVDWAQSNNWLYAVRVADAGDGAALVAELGQSGIEARCFWRALSDQPPFADAPTCLAGVARALSGAVVTLPSSSGLAAADQDRVIEALARWRGAALVPAA